MSNRETGRWYYEFWLGENYSYQSESQAIDQGDDLIAYENEYFLQAFSPDVDVDYIKDGIDAIRSYPTSETTAPVHLKYFSDLRGMARPDSKSLFKMNFAMDRDEQEWMYRFSIAGVTLYNSGPIEIPDENPRIVCFQRFFLWERFELVAESWPLTLDDLSDIKRRKWRGVDRSLNYDLDTASVRIFMEIAAFAATHQKKSAIQLQGNYFTLILDGHILYRGEIPEASEIANVTPRVLITGAAMEVALLPLEKAYGAIMANFGKYQSGSLGIGADSPLTLLSVVSDKTAGLQRIKFKSFFNLVNHTASYELKARFDHGAEVKFSVIETGAIKKRAASSDVLSLPNEKRLLRALCRPLISEIYTISEPRMTEQEKIGLYELMHRKLHVAGFSLGDIFDIPGYKPVI